MTQSQTPHEVLGVSEDASEEDIRIAYRALCQIFHPDRFDTGPEAVLAQAMRHMQAVNWAYSELRNMNPTFVWYETTGWSNIDRGRITAKLLNRGIPHRWDNDELVVERRYESEVDKLM